MPSPGFTTLVNFDGSDGSYPNGVTIDAAGNIDGTTATGGTGNSGTVFELAAGSSTPATLVSFIHGSVENPSSPVVDAAGDIYGLAFQPVTLGVIFEIAAGSHAVTTVHDFTGGVDGGYPISIGIDSVGDLFGTTSYGGTIQAGEYASGTDFEVAAGSHALTTLKTFYGAEGTGGPASGLTEDASGDLFGVTASSTDDPFGTVDEVSAGTVAVFDSTTGSGSFASNLIVDAAGDLFGTISNGGVDSDGTLYEVPAGSGSIPVLHTFDGMDGSYPVGQLLIDAAGNLYGVTSYGGANGDGTVFRYTAATGMLTTLYNFGGLDGAHPETGLSVDSSGDLIGVTSEGGTDSDGTLFKITNAGFVLPTSDPTVTRAPSPTGSNLHTATLGTVAPASAGDPLTVALTADSVFGLTGSKLAISNGMLIYTPGLITAATPASDTIAYTVTDTVTGGMTKEIQAVALVVDGASVFGPMGGGADITQQPGQVFITVFGLNNTVNAFVGNAAINAGAGNATIRGGKYDDQITLAGMGNLVTDGNGEDTVTQSSGGGNSNVSLGDGTDSVTLMGTGNRIAVGNGSDMLAAGSGSAFVSAGSGNDSFILAGTGNRVAAGDGNDTVSGGQGQDTIILGNGDQTVTENGTGNVITVGTGNSSITAGSGNDTVAAGMGNQTIALAGSGNTVAAQGGQDLSVTGGSSQNRVSLGGGNVVVTLTAGYNTVQLGAEPNPNPYLPGDVVSLGGGYNTVQAVDNTAVTISGQEGHNTVATGSAAAAAVALDLQSEGPSQIDIGGMYNTITDMLADTIYAGSGHDSVVTGALPADVVLGGGDNTVTLGPATADSGDSVSNAYGTGGDVIHVLGYASLALSGPNETVFLQGGGATVSDTGSNLTVNVIADTGQYEFLQYNPGNGLVVDLKDGSYSSPAAALAALHDDGSGAAVLALKGGGQLQFDNTPVQDFTVANFRIG